jgi:O-antigen/teichoic acid export membrane protein
MRFSQMSLSFRNLLNQLFTSKTVHSTVWLGSSSAVAGVLGAATSAILTRALGVEDYGVYVLVITLMGLLTDVADLGLASSIVRFGSASLAENDFPRLRTVISIVSRWKLLVASIVMLLAVLFVGDIASYLFKNVDPRVAYYARLSLVATGIGIVASIFTPILQAFSRFRTQSLLVMFKSGTRLVGVVLLAYALAIHSIESLIWLEILVLALFLVLSYISSPFKAFSFTLKDRQLARTMWSFNNWISLYQGMALIGGRIDLAFVGGLADARALGIYGSALKISGLVNAVASSLMPVLMSEMSGALSPSALQRKRLRSFGLVGLLIIGIALVALLARPIVIVLFGDAFVDASGVLQILCLGLSVTVLSYPLNASLFATNRSIAFPVVSILSTAATIGGNWYFIPILGVHGAAWAFVLSSVAALCTSVAFFLFDRRKTS